MIWKFICIANHVSCEIAIIEVNEDIKSIINWFNNNGHILNSDKMQAIIFDTAKYINTVNFECLLSRIEIEGSTVLFSTNVKYLNIIISSTLPWERQVTSVV